VACPFSGQETALAIVVEDHGPHLIVQLRGELDLTETDRLREVMNTLVAREPQAAQGRRFLVYGAQPLVRRVLALTGMDTYLQLTPD